MSHTTIYRSDLFTPQRLTSPEVIQNALDEIEAVLSEDTYQSILNQVLREENPLIVALIMSTTLKPLMGWILWDFPRNDYNPLHYHDSFHRRLLSSLNATVHLHLLPTASGKVSEYSVTCHRRLQAAISTLRYLAPFIRVTPSLEADEPPGRKKSQKQLKKERRAANFVLPVLDDLTCEVLDIDPIECEADIRLAIGEILGAQKDDLAFYLTYLSKPEVAQVLIDRCVYIPPEPVVAIVDESKPQVEVEIVPEVPSAYPMVQPMKSALHFDSPEGFGAWRIIISKNAHDVLRSTHRKDQATFNIIVNKIKDLSSGHFSNDNQKPLSGAGTDVPVFEAKMSRDLRLIYQVDLIPIEENREQQAVKIFGIHTHAQMDHRLWDSISSQLRKKGRVYRERCSARKRSEIHADSDMFVPQTFPPLPEVSLSEIEDLPDLLPNDTAQVHSRLVVEKFVTFSQPFLNTVMADLDVTLPHLVSSQEKLIIENPNSCYVIGRSGTGKTTTMLFKMLLVERTVHLVGGDIPRPRQVFVTKSRMLAKKVQEYFSKLATSLSRASQTLAQLIELSKVEVDHDDDVGLVDVDDVHEWRADLPKKFSDLEERHFPLFVTYDSLCDMLEADIADVTHPRSKDVPGRRRSKRTLVNFEGFLSSYWVHFSETARKGLDPALVYSELIGVIKGSEESLSDPKRFLSEVAYRRINEQQHSTLSGRTEEVYALFQTYMQMKKSKGEYDVADRTHNILAFFKEHGVPGAGVDHLYIDEVQDNLLIDTMVLRALCSNPNGLFWAGDTAQTISVGSSFRFDGLKAFQYRLEMKHRANEKTNGAGAFYLEEPKIFQLAINYRSHAGIVNCAHSIIDLINEFWEDSIDRLSPEVGIVDGFKPVFFSNEDREQLEHFIFGDVGSHIEFGAQQCILVRNEAAKERLLKDVGEVGLVLTIYESKGLEFNDVLLYDFFGDSVVGSSTWRVVLNAITDWSRVGEEIPGPVFENIRHATICTELKSLYVAITRARENVWIADASEAGQSMRAYWTSRNLIHNYAPGNDAPQLATSSTSEEWAAQGRELFDQKKYGAAKHCYTRANLPKLAAVANAYHERQKARAIGTTKQTSGARRDAFRSASDAFLACAEAETVASVKQTYHRNSAFCMEGAGDLYRAAFIHRLAHNYDRAGELYRDLKKFDEAIGIVEEARDKMDEDIVNSIIKRARLAYFDAQDIEKGCNLFDSTEEALEYLEDRGLDMARADLLQSVGQTVEAGELHYAEGHQEVAISLFLRDPSNESGMRRALECILEGLWQHCSFGIPFEDVRSDLLVERLLALSAKLDLNRIPPSESLQLEMFKALFAGSDKDLLSLGLKFVQQDIHAAALLCLDHFFSRPLQIQSMPLIGVVDTLETFTTYVTLLSKVTFLVDPWKDEHISRLFGFSRVAENVFRVPSPTWLFDRISRARKTLTSTEFQVSVEELQLQFRISLGSRLRARTEAASDACHQSKAFSPCLAYVVFRSCNRFNCPENHIAASGIGPEFYNQRVRVHLQQILIAQSLRENDHQDGQRRGQKYWISQLYNALYPPHHSLGSISDLDVSKIPEAEKGFNVVRHWVQSLAFTQQIRPHTTFLTDVMQVASLAYAFDRHRVESTKYLQQAPYWSTEPMPRRYYKFGNFIVPELLLSISGSSLGGGSMVVTHIVTTPIEINVNVLCNYIDFLCSSFVLCSRAKNSNFHDITLPRSWLLKYLTLDAEHFNPNMATNRYLNLFQLMCMGTLLEQLYVGGDNAGYLLYGTGQTLASLPPTIRNVFIARLLRSICLLGYNISNTVLRETIRKAILTIRKPNRTFPVLYKEYVDAASHSWDAVARTVRRSLVNDPADEMIHLIWKTKLPKKLLSLIGVRHVVFCTMPEVLKLLGDKDVPDPTVTAAGDHTTTGGSETKDEAPKDEAVTEVTKEAEGAAPKDEVEEDGQEDSEQLVDDSIDNDEGEDIPLPQVPQPPSEEEHAAACVFQRIYRRITSRRKGIPKSGVAGTRNQIFEACTKVVVPDMQYRKMLLGPLVHLLLCLDFARVDSLRHKTTTKDKLRGCLSEEYEKLDVMLTQTIKVHKTIIKLQKELAPTAAVHLKCDKNILVKLVGDAHAVLSTLPFTSSVDVAEDLALAVKGILTPRVVRQRKPVKPALAADDLDY
ncbi:hypothetical protein BDZ89DRAFT_983953 [Hymenopellis radicata]|nr:hypothetical protein BDZ89DRAFT_983953 [Hymenopellis radicata]